jgi:SAM-dependent methyltransferase
MNRWAQIAPYYGWNRKCPVCEHTFRRFQRFGSVSREEARCVACGALERHRLLWLFLRRNTDFFERGPQRLLHVAPERFIEARFRPVVGKGYVSTDLFSPRAMVRMDVTNIAAPDDAFDVVYCSHVLEHVPDDRRAMREFRRVLRRSGWAVFMVPVTAPRTFEDPTVVTDSDRLRVYGQTDHVRRYGPDFADRLREEGFGVTVVGVSDLLDEKGATRHGLAQTNDAVFFCRKHPGDQTDRTSHR